MVTFLLYLNHDTSQEFFWRTTTVDKELKNTAFRRVSFFIGSIISVVGKTTVEIIELFECTQKVP